MLAYVARRLLLLVPVLVGVSLLVFLWVRALPGGPAQGLLGERTTPEAVAALERQYGLDRPLYVQYGRYLNGLLHLRLGTSISSRQPVVEEVARRFPATAELTMAATLVAVGAGIPLGVLAAKRRSSALDHASLVGSLLGISIPVFFLALLLKYVFAVRLGWLPSCRLPQPGPRPGPGGGGAVSDPPEAAATPLLEVEELQVHFRVRRALGPRPVVRAVDGVSFGVRRGETLGLVGESGCGKSTLARAVVRLLEPTAGRVLFDGVDVASLKGAAMRRQRRRMQIVFQDPFASLNPRQSVARCIGEPLRAHGLAAGRELDRQVDELLGLVGLGAGVRNRYPHEFSGGQRQRIGLARALALRPELVVADEPVSALDVSIQAQIVNLLVGLQAELGLTYLFIAHDLAVVRHVSDRVAVMYLGRLVEVAPAGQLYAGPLHPYTISLLQAVPVPDPQVEATRERILLPGDAPSPAAPPPGCRFHTRCPFVQPTRCRDEVPQLRELAPGHTVACHWAEAIRAGSLRPARVAAPVPGPA